MAEIWRFQKDGLGGFADDIGWEGEAAARAGRPADQERLRELWLGYLETRLAKKSNEALIRYLESRVPWREEGVWAVFRNPDPPCIAFTAAVLPDGRVELIALAACDRFPDGGEEAWWQKVVRPRVRQL